MQELNPDTLEVLPRRLRSIGSLDPGNPVSKATCSAMAHSHVEPAGLGPPESRQQAGCVTFEVLCMAPDCQTRIAVRTTNVLISPGVPGCSTAQSALDRQTALGCCLFLCPRPWLSQGLARTLHVLVLCMQALASATSGHGRAVRGSSS